MRTRAAKEGLEVPPELEDEVGAQAEGHLLHRIKHPFHRRKLRGAKNEPGRLSLAQQSRSSPTHPNSSRTLKTAMIRRTGTAPKPIDPSGWISAGRATTEKPESERQDSRESTPYTPSDRGPENRQTRGRFRPACSACRTLTTIFDSHRMHCAYLRNALSSFTNGRIRRPAACDSTFSIATRYRAM